MRCAFATLALLAACGPGDFSRPGTWQATGVNDVNLRAMLTEPAHAVRGVGAATDRAEPAVQALHRLQDDRRRPLPDSRAAHIGSVGGGAPAAATAGSRAN